MNGVLLSKNITMVATGGALVIVLTADNKLISWGALTTNTGTVIGAGDGATLQRSTPVNMDMTAFGSKAVSKISTGAYTAQALTTDGSVFGLGDNSYLMVGDGTVTNRLVFTANTILPTALWISGETVSDITQAAVNFIVTTSSGRTLWMGESTDYQLATAFAPNVSAPIELMRYTTKVQMIAAYSGANSKNIMILTDGCSYNLTSTPKSFNVTCNAQNTVYQFGTGYPSSTKYLLPTVVTGFVSETIVDVIMGMGDVPSVAVKGFAMALSKTGKLFSWGINTYGTLGDGTSTTNGTPQDITAITTSPLYKKYVNMVSCKYTSCKSSLIFANL
jgi:alpha-tubulin suppressor-like RCC1 family protein